MPVTTESLASVGYEGSSPGTDTWWYTQANFLVAIPGRNSKESAILMNEPAGKFLAAELGMADSAETRDALPGFVKLVPPHRARRHRVDCHRVTRFHDNHPK